MKVYIKIKNGCHNVSKIEFCCGKMAKDILFGKVKPTLWTDHPLNFWVMNDTHNEKIYLLKHCGHCGAKIYGGEIEK